MCSRVNCCGIRVQPFSLLVCLPVKDDGQDQECENGDERHNYKLLEPIVGEQKGRLDARGLFVFVVDLYFNIRQMNDIIIKVDQHLRKALLVLNFSPV